VTDRQTDRQTDKYHKNDHFGLGFTFHCDARKMIYTFSFRGHFRF